MPLASMTGYARAEGQAGDLTWAWEIRSVNGRSLDVRCRLPAGMDGLEQVVRTAVADRVARGHVSVSMQLTRPTGTMSVEVNRALLDQLLGLARDLDGVRGVAPPRLDALLATRGVIELRERVESEDERTAHDQAMRASLGKALDALVTARSDEGQRLGHILARLLDDIAQLTAAAREAAAAQPEAIKVRLRDKVGALLDDVPALPVERIAQEAALLMVKADVREELDRLESHVAQARGILGGDGAKGRRLEFLAQEFNREANTLCSKSADLALTQIGLQLKGAIDRVREQVQNIE